MIRKIRRSEALKQFPKFPQENLRKDEFYYPETYNSFILTMQSKSVKGHQKSLSTVILNLSKNLGFTSLFFLGDSNIPWRFQENNHKSVNEAYDYFETIKVGKRFNGALEVSQADLPILIKHLFSLTRYNASFPIVHFSNAKQDIIVSLCQYGNIHFSTLNKEIDNAINEAIEDTQLIKLKSNKCVDPFSKTGAIKGRTTVV